MRYIVTVTVTWWWNFANCIIISIKLHVGMQCFVQFGHTFHIKMVSNAISMWNVHHFVEMYGWFSSTAHSEYLYTVQLRLFNLQLVIISQLFLFRDNVLCGGLRVSVIILYSLSWTSIIISCGSEFLLLTFFSSSPRLLLFLDIDQIRKKAKRNN